MRITPKLISTEAERCLCLPDFHRGPKTPLDEFLEAHHPAFRKAWESLYAVPFRSEELGYFVGGMTEAFRTAARRILARNGGGRVSSQTLEMWHETAMQDLQGLFASVHHALQGEVRIVSRNFGGQWNAHFVGTIGGKRSATRRRVVIVLRPVCDQELQPCIRFEVFDKDEKSIGSFRIDRSLRGNKVTLDIDLPHRNPLFRKYNWHFEGSAPPYFKSDRGFESLARAVIVFFIHLDARH